MTEYPAQPNPSDPTPPKRRLPALIFVGVALFVVAGAVVWASRSSSSAEEKVPQPPAAVAPSPSPEFRPAKVGQPFEVAPWRITVTSIKCGTAHDLLAENEDNGQAPTDRVCVAAISYTNIDKVPHDYGSGFDTSNPSPVDTFLGFAGEAAYVGTKWVAGTVNPGLSQSNQLIFAVPAGIVLDAVQIGDVLVKP